MRIYIPSRARAGQNNHTYDRLPPALQRQVSFVISREDKAEYAARWPMANLITTNKVGIGPVRQLILDHHYALSCKDQVEPQFVMCDDDLVFFVRRDDDPTKARMADGREMVKMFVDMEKALKKYAHAGFTAREGANHTAGEKFLFDTRMLRVLGYDASVLKRERIRYDRCPVMEDFDVTLQLLEKGYSNVVLNDYIHNQAASNAPGGCSTYRTPEVQAEGARSLHRLHPEFVTVIEKPAPKSGTWDGKPRIDVRIAWKKARNSYAG